MRWGGAQSVMRGVAVNYRACVAPAPPVLPADLAAWLDYIQAQHPQSIALGLDRVRAVARRMRLKRPARRVVSVAGTNGKGSTVAFIEAIAGAAGRRVGAYTSPHLLRYNERVRIGGVEATDAELVAGFEAVEAARGETPLTYFEYGTLAALWLFQRAQLDLAVLEVGLGGRLDAVNLVDADVAVIATVAVDHQDWLGSDREAIGLEKAGILRAGRPAVLAEADPPASVLRHAYELGASAIRAGCDYRVERGERTWFWREPGFELELPYPALRAPAQLDNAAAAIAALRAARLKIGKAAFAQGVAQARLAGRLQSLPLPLPAGEAELLLDVAHNPQAARQLADWLAAHPPPGRSHALFGALADKDVAGMLAPLRGSIQRWWLAGLDAASPRGLSATALALKAGGLPDHSEHATVDAAFAAARAALHPGDRLLAFGSFFTVAGVLALIEKAHHPL